MSTGRCIAVAAALALLVFILAAMVTTSKPSPFEPATCPGCEPVPYIAEETP